VPPRYAFWDTTEHTNVIPESSSRMLPDDHAERSPESVVIWVTAELDVNSSM
jgi:hypothetical protein